MFTDYQIIIEQSAHSLKTTAENMVKQGWIPLGDITAVADPKHCYVEFMLQMVKIDPATGFTGIP